jgi:hypothetical protein
MSDSSHSGSLGQGQADRGSAAVSPENLAGITDAAPCPSDRFKS